MSPNRVQFVRTLEILNEIVLKPPSRLQESRYLARAILGFVMLAALESSLSLDFYAVMTLAGIELRGMVKPVTRGGKRVLVHVLPDPEQAKRKKLKRLVERLSIEVTAVLKRVPAYYVTPKALPQGQQNDFLDRVPPIGLVCYKGVIHVMRKPKGKSIEHMYTLGEIEFSREMKEIGEEIVIRNGENMNPSLLETCAEDVKSMHETILSLLRENKLGHERTAGIKLGRFTSTTDGLIGRIAYLYACFERPRKVKEWLPVAIRLLFL